MRCLSGLFPGRGACRQEQNGWEGYYPDLEPPILDDERTLSKGADLRRQLSTLPGGEAPREVAWGPGPLQPALSSAFSFTAEGAAAAGPALRAQSIPAEQQRGFLWTPSRMELEAAIAEEQTAVGGTAASPQQAEAALVAGEQGLLARLNRLNLDMRVMEGDGNCQFRAISHGLYGTQRHHGAVRRRAVEHARQHRPRFEAFMGDDPRRYLEDMARGGTWGDELTLHAVCEAYGVVINVVTSDEEHWFVRYIPRHTTIQRELFLTYLAPAHYNAVARRHAAARLRGVLRPAGAAQRSRVLAALRSYEARQAVPASPAQLAAPGGAAAGAGA